MKNKIISVGLLLCACNIPAVVLGASREIKSSPSISSGRSTGTKTSGRSYLKEQFEKQFGKQARANRIVYRGVHGYYVEKIGNKILGNAPTIQRRRDAAKFSGNYISCILKRNGVDSESKFSKKMIDEGINDQNGYIGYMDTILGMNDEENLKDTFAQNPNGIISTGESKDNGWKEKIKGAIKGVGLYVALKPFNVVKAIIAKIDDKCNSRFSIRLEKSSPLTLFWYTTIIAYLIVAILDVIQSGILTTSITEFIKQFFYLEILILIAGALIPTFASYAAWYKLKNYFEGVAHIILLKRTAATLATFAIVSLITYFAATKFFDENRMRRLKERSKLLFRLPFLIASILSIPFITYGTWYILYNGGLPILVAVTVTLIVAGIVTYFGKSYISYEVNLERITNNGYVGNTIDSLSKLWSLGSKRVVSLFG